MPANTGAANSSKREDKTMTQKFTISARRGDQFLGDDETHVGTYAGKLLTQAEADEAIADLLASQPEGWDDVGYTADATAETSSAPRLKSITPVQRVGGQGGWDVRIRLQDGVEQLLDGSYPYTLAQAEQAARNAERDAARHGPACL
jgi:hypothetical protein